MTHKQGDEILGPCDGPLSPIAVELFVVRHLRMDRVVGKGDERILVRDIAV